MRARFYFAYLLRSSSQNSLPEEDQKDGPYLFFLDGGTLVLKETSIPFSILLHSEDLNFFTSSLFSLLIFALLLYEELFLFFLLFFNYFQSSLFHSSPLYFFFMVKNPFFFGSSRFSMAGRVWAPPLSAPSPPAAALRIEKNVY